jgi:hypothetical protein
MAMQLAMTREVRMVASNGDGDDQSIPQRPARPPNLLRYEERADTRSTRHARVGSKIGTPQIRPNIVHRVDAGAEIVCIRLAVAQLTKGEWECWIALKEGVLFDPAPKGARGIYHRHWFVVPLPAKSATVEQTARHYGYTERSVKEMDRTARRLLARFREAAGLVGEDVRVPIWPAVCTDENLLRYLYGSK